jgi:hypothetical protein
LRECVTPVLKIRSLASALSKAAVAIKSKKWIGLRCKIEVETRDEVYAVLRTKPAGENSIICPKKKITGGSCTLIVEDDDLVGSSAVLVLLDSEGQLLDKQATIVGE